MKKDVIAESSTEHKSLVLDNLRQAINMVDDTQGILDEKADRMIQTGSVVLGLLGFLNLNFAKITDLSKGIFAAATVCFIVTVIFTQLTTWTRKYPVLGPSKTEHVNERYLGISYDAAFAQAVTDLLDTRRKTIDINESKARWLKWAIVFMVLEILLLVLLIFINLFS